MGKIAFMDRGPVVRFAEDPRPLRPWKRLKSLKPREIDPLRKDDDAPQKVVTAADHRSTLRNLFKAVHGAWPSSQVAARWRVMNDTAAGRMVQLYRDACIGLSGTWRPPRGMQTAY